MKIGMLTGRRLALELNAVIRAGGAKGHFPLSGTSFWGFIEDGAGVVEDTSLLTSIS